MPHYYPGWITPKKYIISGLWETQWLSDAVCCCCLGYSVGAGHFVSPSSEEVVGGAPQYNQKGKVRHKKGQNHKSFPSSACIWLSVVLFVSLQVFIFTIDNSRLRIVFELPGKEVGHEDFRPALIPEYIALKQMSSCSLDLILAPVSAWWISTLMGFQIFWLGLLWQQATPERREKYMCTSTRDR